MTVVASVSRAQFCLRPHRHAVLVSVTDSSIAVTAFIIIKRLFQSVTDCERFQVLTAASMMFRIVFWDILPCKIIVDRRFSGAYCLHPRRQL
jgi:hypothetical protein